MGLYFYEARYYDAALGRFISADTIVPDPNNPQSLNRYSYVLNNPLRYTDPTGNGPHDNAVLDFLNDIANVVVDFFTPTPPPPVFLTTPGIPLISPIQAQASANFFRPHTTQAQRLGLSLGGLSTGANNLAGGLFGLFGVRQSQLDIFQLGLAIGGTTPTLGFFPDIANVGIDLLALDFGAAIIDGGASIPALGLGASPFSIGRRVASNSTGLLKRDLQTLAPHDGFFANFRKVETLQPGTLIDRFGARDGFFVSPAGTLFSRRGLPPENFTLPLNRLEVVRPLDVDAGIAAHAFGGGGGIQYKLPSSVDELIEGGVLK